MSIVSHHSVRDIAYNPLLKQQNNASIAPAAVAIPISCPFPTALAHHAGKYNLGGSDYEDKALSARLLGKVLQTLGVEAMVLGFLSYMAELWARRGWIAHGEVPPRILVALAELTRALTHTSSLIALTALGVLLIVVGAAFRRLNSNE